MVKAIVRYVDGIQGAIVEQGTYDRYDALGNRVRHIDALGRLTTYAYDELGRLTGVTDAAGGVIQRDYDAVGNVIRDVDLRRNIRVLCSHDAARRILRIRKQLTDIFALVLLH